MTTDNLPTLSLKKGDKITMAIIGVIGLIAFVLIGVVALPYVLEAIKNTIYLGIMGGGLVLAVLSIISNWTSLVYKWKNMSRNIRRTVARENPLGVMDTAIGRFARKLEDIRTNVSKADAAAKQQMEAIRATKAEQVQQENLLAEAQHRGRPDVEIQRYAIASERRRKSVENMLPLAETLNQVHEKMEQAREMCINKLEDMKDQRSVFAREYAAMMSGQKAVHAFRNFFSSNPDLEMLQLSIEEIDRQTAEAEADIDQFMRDIQPALNAASLQKGADATAALARINASKLLTGTTTEGTLVTTKEGVLVSK